MTSGRIRKAARKALPEPHTLDNLAHMVRDVDHSEFNAAYPGALSPYMEKLQATHVYIVYLGTVDVQYVVLFRFQFNQSFGQRIQLLYNSGNAPVSSQFMFLF
jgi:hypothetical protein